MRAAESIHDRCNGITSTFSELRAQGQPRGNNNSWKTALSDCAKIRDIYLVYRNKIALSVSSNSIVVTYSRILCIYHYLISISDYSNYSNYNVYYYLCLINCYEIRVSFFFLSIRV